MKHYHAMNGSSGCMPDNNEVFTSKEAAARFLCDMFDNERGLYTALKNSGTYYFKNPCEAGAEYAEISACYEDDCAEDLD